MGLDIRTPIGLMFGTFGLLLAFGAVMLWLARRGARKP